MLADAENAILPGLLLIVVLYPVSIWTLIRGARRRLNALTISCAAVIAVVGGAGLVAVMKDFEWPPDQGLVISVLFWAFPLFAGIVALSRVKHGQPKKD
jgi:hypothetical protein